MSNLLSPYPELGPTLVERASSIRKIKEIKGLRGGVRKYTAKEIPQVGPVEAEKRTI